MIQRIQSIYLLFALILVGSAFVVPFWQFQSSNGMVERIQSFQHVRQEGESWIMIENIRETEFFFEHEALFSLIAHGGVFTLNVLNVVLLLIMIFAYRKRKQQMKLGRSIIIMTMLQILLLVYVTLQPAELLTGIPSSRVDYGFAFPALTIIFVWLANRGIRRDDELVKSVDRIR
ncbi:MAG: DUF4293 domain-containing protein [Bacteroidota bacterium]